MAASIGPPSPLASLRRGEQAAADRQFLEGLLHPRIRRLLAARTATQFAAEGRPAVVLDAPLLLEANWGPMCDVIVMVDADRGRAASTGPGSGAGPTAEFARREAAQWPVDEKRRARQRR